MNRQSILNNNMTLKIFNHTHPNDVLQSDPNDLLQSDHKDNLQGDNRDNNEWQRYLETVTCLSIKYAQSYPNLQDQNRHNQYEQNKLTQQHQASNNNHKMTKSKHFIQLLSYQQQQLDGNFNTNNIINNITNNKSLKSNSKHALIRSILNNLTQCQQIDTKMEELLREMALVMDKCEKMRREEITKIKLHSIPQSNQDTPQYSNQGTHQYSYEKYDDEYQKPQVNQEAINYLREFHGGKKRANNNNTSNIFGCGLLQEQEQGFDKQSEEEEIKIERFDFDSHYDQEFNSFNNLSAHQVSNDAQNYYRHPKINGNDNGWNGNFNSRNNENLNRREYEKVKFNSRNNRNNQNYDNFDYEGRQL